MERRTLRHLSRSRKLALLPVRGWIPRTKPRTARPPGEAIDETLEGSRLSIMLRTQPCDCLHTAAQCASALGHDTRAIQAWLGHRSITSTAIYAAQAPKRFKDFWQD
jgi:type 1 fimbriae regulatory protein FimB/type 1 fimbriae regulatory protein FimE